MKRDTMIFIITRRTGYIPQLKLAGPIVYPYKVPANVAYSLVAAGIEVYRVDPKTKDTVLLTVQNVYDDNIFNTEEKPEVSDAVQVVKPEVKEEESPKVIHAPTIDAAAAQMVLTPAPEETTEEENSDEVDEQSVDGEETVVEETSEEAGDVQETAETTEAPADTQQPKQNNSQKNNQKQNGGKHNNNRR